MTVRIGLGQWRPVPGAAEENLDAAVALVEEAAAGGCDLVALPELWPCGYAVATLAADVAAAAEPLDGPRGRVLADLARRHALWLAAGSVPEADGGRRYNTAVLYAPDGRLVARHRKLHRYAPGGEHAAFDAGDRLTVVDCGPPLGRVGLTVCFDGDFPETARRLREAGARLVVQAAAYEHAAEAWWERLYPAYALANGQWWVLANVAGGGCFGRSCVLSPAGDVVAEGPRAEPGATPPPHVVIADVDLAGGLRAADAEGGVLWEDRRPDVPLEVVDAAAAPVVTA